MRTRDELAEELFIRELTKPEDGSAGYWDNPNDRNKVTCDQWCYIKADAFIAERERQQCADIPLEIGCQVTKIGYDMRGYITMYSDENCKWLVRWDSGMISEEVGVNLKRIPTPPSAPEVESETRMVNYKDHDGNIHTVIQNQTGSWGFGIISWDGGGFRTKQEAQESLDKYAKIANPWHPIN